MATYSTIKGMNVPTLGTDPTNPTQGQVWYNSVSATLKGYGQQGTGAWGSESSLNTQRGDSAGCGTITAAIQMGGWSPPAPPYNGQLTEEFNGTSWSSGGNLPSLTNTQPNGQGTQTATLQVGNNADTKVAVEYNGASWTAGNDRNDDNIKYGAGAGTQTAGSVFGGYITTSGPGAVGTTEEYDGTSFSGGGTMNTAVDYLVGGGTQTASIKATGLPGSTTAAETYDGTTWTNIPSCNTATHGSYATTNGTQTAFLKMTGTVPGVTANVEEWNGSVWAEIANVTTARQGGSGAGSALSGMVCGAGNPATTSVESYVVPDAIKTFTSS